MQSIACALRPGALASLPSRALAHRPLQAPSPRPTARTAPSKRQIAVQASAGGSAGAGGVAAAAAAIFSGDAQAQLARFKLLLAVNVAVPLPLGLSHIFAPAFAAKWAWLGFAAPHALLFPLLGSLWAAVGIASVLALLSSDPLKFSAVALIQATYKVLFLAVAILPAVLAGNSGAFPVIPTLVFSSYLPLLALTGPWAYLFPK